MLAGLIFRLGAILILNLIVKLPHCVLPSCSRRGVTNDGLPLPLRFQSPWSWGIGMEYSMTDRLKFRLGYEPRKSAIPDNRRNSLVPINNAQLFGAGIGYRFDPESDIDLTIFTFAQSGSDSSQYQRLGQPDGGE